MKIIYECTAEELINLNGFEIIPSHSISSEITTYYKAENGKEYVIGYNPTTDDYKSYMLQEGIVCDESSGNGLKEAILDQMYNMGLGDTSKPIQMLLNFEAFLA
jgi:hypothetical protein